MRTLVFVTVLTIAVSSSAVRADGPCEVIYESFNDEFPPSQTEPFGFLNIWIDGEHTGTIEVVPKRDYELCEIQFMAAHQEGPNDYFIALYRDRNGVPGDPPIGYWPVDLPPAKGVVPVTTLDVSSSNIVLERGESYWIGIRISNYEVGRIHLSSIPGAKVERAEIILSRGGWVRTNPFGWDPTPGAYRLLGENLGGVDCTGKEKLGKLKCRNSGGKRSLKVKLKNSTPDDTFVATLATGETRSGTINSRGKGKAKFKNLASGSNLADVIWDCGATASGAFNCP